MRIDLAGPSPPQLATCLRLRRPVDRAGTEQVNEEVKAAGGPAAHFVQRHWKQVSGAIARLLEELAARSVLEALVALHVPTREEPRARERSGRLFDEEDPSGVIDARDDRAYARPSGHVR